MPRKSRIVLEGFPILTFQQTLDGVTAFRDRRDFETCLSFVSEAVIDFGVSCTPIRSPQAKSISFCRFPKKPF
jgi:hypothetical protein